MDEARFKLDARPSLIIAISFCALLLGLVVTAVGHSFSGTPRLPAVEHVLFAAAWSAFCLRFVRVCDDWQPACDLVCITGMVFALIFATW